MQYNNYNFIPIVAPYGGDVSQNAGQAAKELSAIFDKNEALHLQLEKEYALAKTIEGDDAGKKAVREQIDKFIGNESKNVLQEEGKVAYHRIGNRIKSAVLNFATNPDFLAEQESYLKAQEEIKRLEQSRASGAEILDFTDPKGHKTVITNPDGTKSYNIYQGGKEVKADWHQEANKWIGNLKADGYQIDINTLANEISDLQLNKDTLSKKRYKTSQHGVTATKANSRAKSVLSDFIANSNVGNQMYRAYTQLPKYMEGKTQEEIHKNAVKSIGDFLKLTAASQVGVTSSYVSSLDVKNVKNLRTQENKESPDSDNIKIEGVQKVVQEPINTTQAKQRLDVLKNSNTENNIIRTLGLSYMSMNHNDIGAAQEFKSAYSQYKEIGDIRSLQQFYNKYTPQIQKAWNTRNVNDFFKELMEVEIDNANNQAILEGFENYKNNPETKSKRFEMKLGVNEKTAGFTFNVNPNKPKTEEELFKEYMNQRPVKNIKYTEQVRVPYYNRTEGDKINQDIEALLNQDNIDIRGYVLKDNEVSGSDVSMKDKKLTFLREGTNLKIKSGSWILDSPIIGKDGKPIYGYKLPLSEKNGHFIIPLTSFKNMGIDLKRVEAIMQFESKKRETEDIADKTGDGIAYMLQYNGKVITQKVRESSSSNEDKTSIYATFFLQNDGSMIELKNGLIATEIGGVMNIVNPTGSPITTKRITSDGKAQLITIE